MDSLLDMMRKNRGNRNFRDKAVPQKILLKILEAGAAAPSGIINGVHIYVVDDPFVRNQIHEISVQSEKVWLTNQPEGVRKKITDAPDYDPGLEFLRKAPLLLVISTRPRDPEIPYAVEAAFMAIGYMLVMAKGVGLIAAPYAPGSLHEAESASLDRVLNLPDGETIQALLPMGYPATLVSDRKASISRNVFHNQYGKKFFS